MEPTASTQWEYHVESFKHAARDPEYLQNRFNHLGEQGWELSADLTKVAPTGSTLTFVFKRPGVGQWSNAAVPWA